MNGRLCLIGAVFFLFLLGGCIGGDTQQAVETYQSANSGQLSHGNIDMKAEPQKDFNLVFASPNEIRKVTGSYFAYEDGYSELVGYFVDLKTGEMIYMPGLDGSTYKLRFAGGSGSLKDKNYVANFELLKGNEVISRVSDSYGTGFVFVDENKSPLTDMVGTRSWGGKDSISLFISGDVPKEAKPK